MSSTSDTSAAAFAAKWRENARRERASSQEHFIDLCRLLDVPTPNEADPTGESYAFEAGAERLSTGRRGWADVWKRGHFGWEYKGAHADLAAAYKQLLDYREDLENPPALVVSDMDRIEVHTNFTGTRPAVLTVTLDDLAAGGDLEHEAIRWGAERLRIPGEFPRVDPHNVLGIEINPYAKELAGVSIWIGHIQWMLDHGYGYPRDPVLEPLDNIELRDAILAYDDEGAPVPATWPEAEFVVGNPPFLGRKLMRGSLRDRYVDDVDRAYGHVIHGLSDYVCYWHEVARRQIVAGGATRVGLLATNSIRDGSGRRTLERIKDTGDIFMAWSDEPWIVEGAAVRVSIIAQDDGSEEHRTLDGTPVSAINRDLTSGLDFTNVARLPENGRVSFIGDQKNGSFDITRETAREMLRQPTNINGRPNSDVIFPWVNGKDIAGRPSDAFVVDFGTTTTQVEAAAWEAPFAYVAEHVRPEREVTRQRNRRERWWLHGAMAVNMREAIATLPCFIITPITAKHRLFAWLSSGTMPGSTTVAIAREDDYAFGVLHSRAHELWSLRMGTWLGVGNDPRYTPTSTFETFPFPWPLDTPDEALTHGQRVHRDAIGEAARALDDARRRWLNPPELVREEPDVVPSLPPRLLPVDEDAERELKRRTLTNLYNQRPAWLAHLHDTLDAAVFAAYGWEEAGAPGELGEEELLGRLLALNLERAGGGE